MPEQTHQIAHNSNLFEIIRKVGNGVFGKVYHVRESKSPYREYALKKIFNCNDVNKINNEIQALKLLNKYHIGLHLYSVETGPEGVSLLLEYSPGSNLIRHAKKNGPLTEDQLTKLLSDMLEMLRFLQNHALLHLDIKPTNILVHSGKYDLIDWGLSKWGTHARTIRLNGNAIYFPPEMYYGERNIASEIYSLGCVLYFALTGKEIFGLDYNKPLCQKIYSHIVFKPEFPEGISNRFQFLVERMTEKDPQNRITIPEIEHVLSERKKHELARHKTNEPIDFSNEIGTFKRLAKKNVPYAQHLLSKYYQRGDMVEKDLVTAFNLNSRAAEFHIAKAQFELGVAYRDGKGVDPDENKAYDLFTASAKQGFDPAQFALARMLEKGSSPSADIAAAQYWYEQAALNGHKKAMARINVFDTTIT